MSWKSTLILVLLAAGTGAWFFLGDEVAPRIGLNPANPEPTKSAAIAILDGLKAQDITAVKIAYPSGEAIEVSRADTHAPWKMPGNWPIREAQVRELVETLGNLRTRFHAKPAAGDDLTQYGLAADQRPLRIVLTLKSGTGHTLTFGDPNPGEEYTAFTRPAFVRVDDIPEILTLGPNVMPVLARSAESYRRRQLFMDVERVRIAGGNAAPTAFGAPPSDSPVVVTLPGEETETIAVRGDGPMFFSVDLAGSANFTLARTGKLPEPEVVPRGGEPALPVDRLADVWRMAAPHSDPAEPVKLRGVLAAVADLWVDHFVTVDPIPLLREFPAVLESPLARAARLAAARKEEPSPDKRMGFTDSRRAITVKTRANDGLTVEFGGIARIGEREEPMTIPGGPPGAPPQTTMRKVPTEFRYARVAGNPQVFIVPAEKFSDLFVSAADLADPRVARFEPDEVQEITLQRQGGMGIKFFRKKGNASARKDEDKQDRWFIDATPNPLLAESSRVTDLLDKLSAMRTEKEDRREYPTAAPPAHLTITITAQEQRAPGEPEAPKRTYTIVAGKPDPVANLLPVRLADMPRVSLVNDKIGSEPAGSWIGALLFPETLSAFLERPQLAYRNLKLFDTTDRSLVAVGVAGAFELKKAGDAWRLAAPIDSAADAGKADQLASSLSSLRASEFLSDKPTAAELKSYGLEKPAQTVTLGFTGNRTYTLELGAKRPGKTEVFARLDRGGVFALPSSATEQLTSGAVGLLPLNVWSTSLDRITSVEIIRAPEWAKESFTLAKEGNSWKLTAPFQAPVPGASVQPLSPIAKLTAVKYQALTAANDAEFGFDKPFLKAKITYREQKPGDSAETAVTKTVIVGGTLPGGLDHYARLDVPNAPVFVVGAEFLLAAQVRPLNLLDRSLLSLDPARITKVRVGAAKPEDAFTLAKDGSGKWSAEGTTFAVDQERIAGLTTTAARLLVMYFVAYGTSIKWADYGLEKPANAVTVTLDGDKPATHTISLGNLDPTGARFVRVDDKPAVGVINTADAETLVRQKFEYADRSLMNFDPSTLVAFTRTAGKSELELAPAAGIGWDIVKPAKQKADQPLVDELAESLGRLRALRVAAYGKKAEMFKKFGLDAPAAAIALTVGEAQQKKLLIGNPVEAAKPEGDRFAAVESDRPEIIVGVLPAALVNKLLAPPVAFRDRTLAKFVDADQLVLERGDRKITFTKTGVTWKVTEPLAASAESAELETLVAELGKLRADTWVGEKGKDLKPYGLDRPEAKWTFSYDGKPVLVLLIGKKNADGRVYATTDKSDLVALLDPARSDRVLAEYRQRKPWDVDAAQIDSVNLAIAGKKFALEKAGMNWIDPAKPGDAIDIRVVNELLGTLGALRVERYAADKDANLKLFGLEKPEATLEVNSKAGRRVLEIGGGVGGTNGTQHYARVADGDRTDVFILTAADTMRLTRDRAMYVQKK